MISDKKLEEIRAQARKEVQLQRRGPKVIMGMEPVEVWVIVSELIKLRKMLVDIQTMINSKEASGERNTAG